ncbi:MAG TPA: energy transducer TonB [Xanthomonadales bacterium]|nr:energy transducer TonB [Xanthomonadales bacterium]
MSLRLPLGLIFGAVFSLVLFWTMWRLVSGPIDIGEMRQATRVEFTRMRQDTEVTSKDQEKPQPDKPPPVPEIPQMNLSSGSIDNNVAQLTPMVDASGAMSKMTMSAGSDRDIIPLVRINPDYPPRAVSRGIEGYVIVQFTITATGMVKDVIVVDAKPKGMFDDAAVRAVQRWRYNPKVEEGVAVERVGVQTMLTFHLEE